MSPFPKGVKQHQKHVDSELQYRVRRKCGDLQDYCHLFSVTDYDKDEGRERNISRKHTHGMQTPLKINKFA